MALDAEEARKQFAHVRAQLDKLEAALEPDADGKVRVTKAEGQAVLTGVLVILPSLIIDIID